MNSVVPPAFSFALFGAAPDTGNMGVSALCYATLRTLYMVQPQAEVTVFDYGRGLRTERAVLDKGEVGFRLCGGFDTRRIFRPESFWQIRLCARLGLRNAGASVIKSARAVMDISGGDSFTDLYGSRRFWAVTLPKLIALEIGKPLILLPQTYGPFADSRLKGVAERVVRSASMAWARDERSFAILRDLAGSSFDPARHLCGVDVAFNLEATRPRSALPDEIEGWLAKRNRPIAALNVSGLIYNDPAGGSRYGFKADYRKLVHEIVSCILKSSDARVMLVPHVHTAPGHYESDIDAAEQVLGALKERAKGRVAVVPGKYNQSEIKWVIAQSDWFCGTRMHATIAALSSRVPTAAVAYSDKTLGVFESCGQGSQVADPRRLTTEEVVEQVVCSWQERGASRRSLELTIPRVVARAREQMQKIVTSCQNRSSEVDASTPNPMLLRSYEHHKS